MFKSKIIKFNFYKNLINYFIKSAINLIFYNEIYLCNLVSFLMLIIMLLILLINLKIFF